MGNFIKSEENPLKYTVIKPYKESHISIRDQGICASRCENKPCTYYCPSRVYCWSDNAIQVDYMRCIECKACPFGCPYGNIEWHYPKAGYGVIYKI
ncbi:ferredoxin family protein [Mahella australiensis]|uniref:Ferredoxin-like protein n=1 Tax=Mahella australiensis (strain DSM 15567 / CIP 107919 / 50-1 BON) TaxID=697281 RepID=F4A0P3_MAHA5|nr:4Fe-4S ferredoxin iron-sulfur binding domain protein [Mahella australiensis 50-1 BON]